MSGSTSSDEEKSSVDLDRILTEIGQFGRFQCVTYLLICLAALFNGFFTLNYVFTAGNLNHRCEIEGCEHVILENPAFIEHAVPFHKNLPEKCLMFGRNESNVEDVCLPQRFNRSSVVKCERVIFEEDEKTIMNEWNLTCPENQWKIALVGTVNFVGQFLCLPLTGFVSDRYGRRTALVLGLVIGGTIGVLKSFSVSYIMFLIFELLDPTVSSGTFASAFVLGMEFVSPQFRVLGSFTISCVYAIANVLLAWFAMLILDWRWLLRTLYAPSILCFFYLFLIPESVRWLISKGKIKKAVETLERIAIMNKRILPKSLLENFQRDHAKMANKNHKNEHSHPLKQLIQSKDLMWRTVNCSFCWLANNFVYYGINLNSVLIGGNKFYNFMLISAVEIPAHIIYLFVLDRFGRRKTLCVSLVISGFLCFLSGITPNDVIWSQLLLLLIGKLAISISFTVLYIYTAEMFPTSLRQTMLSFCSMMGRFGAMLAPQTPLLANYFVMLPFLSFGTIALSSGILSVKFPETLNTKLPNSIEEAMELDNTKNI